MGSWIGTRHEIFFSGASSGDNFSFDSTGSSDCSFTDNTAVFTTVVKGDQLDQDKAIFGRVSVLLQGQLSLVLWCVFRRVDQFCIHAKTGHFCNFCSDTIYDPFECSFCDSAIPEQGIEHHWHAYTGWYQLLAIPYKFQPKSGNNYTCSRSRAGPNSVFWHLLDLCSVS